MAPTPGNAKKRKRQRVPALDECLAEFIKRLIERMSFAEVVPMLERWDVLEEKEVHALNLQQAKGSLALEVVQLCESKEATMDDAAALDILYNHANSNKKTWAVYQMSSQSDSERALTDASKFKANFKKMICSALKNVTINFKEFGESLWIRIAWGNDWMRPNEYKPTFVVYHIQTPYVFMTSFLKSQRPLLVQGLLVATGYKHIQEMQLKGRYLDSLMDIVFKRFSQPFQSYQPRSLPEKSYTPAIVHPKVTHENVKEKERIHLVTLETFGDGPLPKLQYASYKMETAFIGEGDIANKIEPFRCLVKFSSPHLMESIRSLAPSGVSDAPVSSLLTCIPHKGRNMFKISEKKRKASSHAAN